MTPLQHRSGAIPAGRDFRLEIALLAAGIVTMAFGLLALLGWVFGWLRLASFGANMIPMAPSTGVLFLLYGAAICLRARTPLSRPAFQFSMALVGLGTLVALLLFTLGWLHIQWTGEHFGLNLTETAAGARTGHISLVSAFCFLLAGGSFLTSLSPAAIRPWRVGLALVSAGVLLVTSFIFLLAYGFGTPLLYGGTYIPPALNTILAFVALGLALLTLAGRPGGLFRGLSGGDSKPALFFALVFLPLVAGIVAIGYFYYRHYERQFCLEAGQQLAAIAELKVGELVKYRQERLGDAAILHNNSAFTLLTRRFLASPADANAQRQLQEWFGKYQTHYQYERVFLLDAQGGVRLSVPESPVPVAAVISARAAEVLRSGQPGFQDFYRHELSQRIYLSLLIPIRDAADGNRPLGVVVLQIDPATYLYPFISRWPVPSATAETLLIRREGNEAVFLNELRFQTNTALTLRSSLANTNMPAVKAALGQEDIVAGSDYRDVPVLAALRVVPDSPWFLVARRDVAEMYAPLRGQLWQVVALIGVLLFGVGAGVGLLWRQQRVRFYQEKAATAEALQRNQALLTQTEKLGRVGGWEIDIETQQLTWTETVYDIHELDGTGRPTVDQGINYYTPASRRIIERAVQRAIEQGEPFDVELEIITAKGNRRSVHAVGKADRARCKVSGFFQDITEHKRAEAERQKFAMLADSSSEFIGMCDLDLKPLYVNPAGVRMVGLPDLAAACQVKVQDYFFPEDQRFIAEEFFPRVLREGHGDVEIRLRHFQTGEPIWMFYYLFSVRDANGEIVGWATVSRDITERKRATEALTASEIRYRGLFESAQDGILILEAETGMVLDVNPFLIGLLGFSHEQFLGKKIWELGFFKDLVANQDNFAELQRKKYLRYEDLALETSDGRRIPVEFISNVSLVNQRKVIQCSIRDITERKQAEEALRQSRQAALNLMTDAVAARGRAEQMSQALRESEAKLRSVIDCSPVPLAMNDAQGNITYVNREFTRTFGYDLGDIPTLTAWWQKAYPDPTYQAEVKTRWQLRLNQPLQEGTAFEPVEANIRCKDGSQRVVLAAATSLTDTFAGTHLVVLYDITERKQAEEALRQSHQLVFKLMTDAIKARDRSEQMSQSLRASEEEIRELNRSLEQRVQERTAELLAANQELDAFAYAVSHDLRQPLRAMNGFSQALVEDFGAALPGAAHEFLNHIIQASQRMGELIDGLLRLSRTTRGELRRDAVDLSALAARLLGELAAAEPEHRVTWTVAPGLAARGDERMIEVVLANLLDNAWKYTAKTPQPKIEVGVMDPCCNGVAAPTQNAHTPPLHHSTTPIPHSPVFFVRDNGAGFDLKHAAKLFQPFQRLHREDEFPGIGIGLATVQRIVQRHGGAIRATAAPGQGATFSFSLSAADGKNKEEQL